MTKTKHQIAVLTGDLVGSTKLGPAKIERAMEALSDCAEVQADWHGAPLNFTRHRGDGWQVVLRKPEMALRSTLAFRAALRSEGSEFDSYMGIAIGPTGSDIPSDLNTINDETFSASGETLENIKGHALGPKFDLIGYNALSAAFALADAISTNWTPTQAQVMLPMLAPNTGLTYTALAETLGKSRQSVTRSLAAANHVAISLALDRIDKAGLER